MQKERDFLGNKELFLNKKLCGLSSWNSEPCDVSRSKGSSWTEQWQAAGTHWSHAWQLL
jgi:hypothetical protein